MEARVVTAVGYAHVPGRNTIKRDVNRMLKRAFVWMLHQRVVPLAVRQWAMFAMMRFGAWLHSMPRWVFIGGASKGNTFENDLLKLILNATAIANIADNAASSPLSNLQLSLHTSDPGEAGDQTTNEIAYTSYARAVVARTSSGWTVSGASATLTSIISFPAGTGGSGTATHFALGTASSGAGKILYSGTVTPNIVTGNGITPQLGTGTTITED